ncbi:MAG: AI-2E family transporter [Syntrophomonadaceae bacterium]
MPERDRFSTRVFGLAVVALLAYLTFRIFEPFIAPVYWAFLLAFMLSPTNRTVRAIVRGRRSFAATLMTIGVALGIAAPAALLAVAFANQAVELGHRLSAVAQSYQISGPIDLLKLPLLGKTIAWLQQRFDVEDAQLRAWLVQGSQAAVQFLLARGRDLLVGVFGIFGTLAVTLFVLFFFFRDGDALAARLIRIIPFDGRRKEKLERHLENVTRAVVFGTVVTALVQGILLGIGFWITGVPSPVVFGALTAVASFVPLVGTALVWVPAALYLWAQGVLWKTLFLVIWSLAIVGTADNFLRPLLVSGKSQVGTLTVFFGALGGLAAFGFVGLFLGPVILALVLALLEFVDEVGPSAA